MNGRITSIRRFVRRRRRDRRGATSVLMVVSMFAILGVAAVTVDVTRLMSIRAELQTAVDAAALAGALELATGGGDASRDTAIAYASRNSAENDSVQVLPDSVVFGIWDPLNNMFLPLPSAAGANAIDVRASKEVGTYFAWALNFLNVRAATSATGWAASPVSESGCVKPWAIPQELLDLNNDGVVEQWEVDQAVNAQQEFVLKGGAGGQSPDFSDTGIPSFFYPVVLPPFYDAGTGEYRDMSGEGGAAEYRNDIANCLPDPIGVGDSLLVEPGNMPGPTVQGARELCVEIVNTYCNPSGLHSPDGKPGMPIIAGFWDSDVAPMGRTAVEVATLGAFRLLQVYPEGQHGVVVGRFERFIAPGEVGTESTTLIRPILVR